MVRIPYRYISEFTYGDWLCIDPMSHTITIITGPIKTKVQSLAPVRKELQRTNPRIEVPSKKFRNGDKFSEFTERLHQTLEEILMGPRHRGGIQTRRSSCP